jgi:hypothetical protein
VNGTTWFASSIGGAFTSSRSFIHIDIAPFAPYAEANELAKDVKLLVPPPTGLLARCGVCAEDLDGQLVNKRHAGGFKPGPNARDHRPILSLRFKGLLRVPLQKRLDGLGEGLSLRASPTVGEARADFLQAASSASEIACSKGFADTVSIVVVPDNP